MLIGITGHRDLVDPDIIYSKCKDLFISLQQTYADTPLRVLSALAEGADQVCAEAALDSGAEVWTILPFEEGAYLKTFSSDAGREKYLSLKSRSSRIIEIGEDPASPEKYVATGNYIVNHCTVLLAVWNGCPSDRRGGTYQVMDFALHRHKYITGMLPANRVVVPVIHMFSERKSQTSTFLLSEKPQAGEISYGDSLEDMKKFDSEGVNAKFFRELFLPLNEFNQTACSRKKSMGIPELIEKEYGLTHWIERYSKSSEMAGYFQSKYLRQMRILFYCGIGGGFCSQFYGGVDLNAWPFVHYFLIGYLLFWGGAFYYWLRSHEKYHEKYLEQRLMTQILKTYIFMRLAGCEETFWDKRAVQCCHNSRLSVSAIKYWSVLAEDDKAVEAQEIKQTAGICVQEKWIKGQISYLSKKIKSGKKGYNNKKKWQYISTVSAIIISSYFIIANLFDFSNDVHKFLMIINGFIVAVPLYTLAMVMIYYDQKNVEKTQKEFQNMYDNFVYIQQCFSTGEPELLKRRIISLGDASIEETLSWLNNYMDSRPEVIKS